MPSKSLSQAGETLVGPSSVQMTGTVAGRYCGSTVAGAPTTGTFQVGDFVVSQDGITYVCLVAGTPGTWTSSSSIMSSVQGPGVLTAYSSVTTVLTTSVPLISGRTYMIVANETFNQITSTGVPTTKILVGGAEVNGVPRVISGDSYAASGTVAYVRSAVGFYTAAATSTVTFSLTAQTSAGSQQISANAANLTIVDVSPTARPADTRGILGGLVVTANVSNVTTEVAVGSGSFSFTIADATRTVAIMGQARLSGSVVADTLETFFRVDNATTGTVLGGAQYRCGATGTGGQEDVAWNVLIPAGTLSAGAHTLFWRVVRSSGTGTTGGVIASATRPASCWVQDIGFGV